ncbi:MAG TPA: hypothetical protein VFB39_16690 [Solirubrobacteraceae bacterium]|nr:hypothetical protein [Solirubrobacteraceae bacterium]
MDGAWLLGTQRSKIRSQFARLRWRRRGAWLWPTFALLTAADAVIGHELPPIGDSQAIFAAVLLGGIFNLLGVIVLSWPLSLLVRRVRPDLPAVIARDYAGTFVVVAITAVLLGVGIAHRSTILQRSADAREAAVRAEAWIGTRAPAAFRREAARLDTLAIEPGRLYRSCVTSADAKRSYCVIVKLWRPAARSVTFAGNEANAVFATGVG